MAGLIRTLSTLRRQGLRAFQAGRPTFNEGLFYSSEATVLDVNPIAKEVYNRQRQILVLDFKLPEIAVDAWVAPNATLIGDVVVRDRSIIWYNSVLRGDLNQIHVGPYSSVGPRTVIHAAKSSPTGLSAETIIGQYVTVGSQCSLRSCVIEDEVIIGDRSVVMEGSVVETHVILGEGSVVPPGRRIPGGQVWAGNPVRFVRDLTSDDKEDIKKLAESTRKVASSHLEEFLPYSTAYIEAEKLKKNLLSKVST